MKSEPDSSCVAHSRRFFLKQAGLVLGGVAVPWSLAGASEPAVFEPALSRSSKMEPPLSFVSLHLDKPYFSTDRTCVSYEGISLSGAASALMVLGEREWRMQQPYL